MKRVATMILALWPLWAIPVRARDDVDPRVREIRNVYALLTELSDERQREPWGSIERFKTFRRVVATPRHLKWLHLLLDTNLTAPEPVRLVMVEVLEAMGKPLTFMHLLFRIRDTNDYPAVRERAVAAALGYRDPRMVLPLRAVLAEPERMDTHGRGTFYRHAHVKEAASLALVKFSRHRLTYWILEQFARRIDLPWARRSCTLALGKLGDPRAFDLLAKLARRDPVVEIRHRALTALGGLRDARSTAILAEHLKGNDPAGLIAALNGLGELGPLAATTAPRMAVILRDSRADLFVRAAVPGALVRVAPESLEVARTLISFLGHRVEGNVAGPPGLVEQRRKLLHVASMVALQFVRSQEAMVLLIETLGDRNPEVARAAGAVLKSIAPRDLGIDRGKWRAWWATHRQGFQFPREGLGPPRTPRSASKK